MSVCLLINQYLSFCLPQNIFILHSFWRRYFSYDRIICWHNFCQHVENAIPLSSGFYCYCWDVRCHYNILWKLMTFFGLDICKTFSVFGLQHFFMRINLDGFLFIPLFRVCRGFQICGLESWISFMETMAFTNELD